MDGANLEPGHFRAVLDVLPVAVYCTDAAGFLTYFNPAAIEFSGRVPTPGVDRWCVTWKLFLTDGAPLAHDQCPMAVALKEGRTVRGEIAIAERPDGSRRRFTPYPTPLRDAAGKIVGGINILVDLTDRSDTDRSAELLAALVDSSIDGIINEHVYRFIQSCSHPEHRDSTCASCGLSIGEPGESRIELHVECYQKTRFNSANREAEAWQTLQQLQRSTPALSRRPSKDSKRRIQ
jgi:PAS domain S-box-containing protein